MCDFNIKCGNKILPVHKLVLASNSEYFNKLFTGNFSKSNTQEIIFDEIFEPDTLELLIDYMYSKHLNITEHNIQVKSYYIYIQLHR